MRAERLRRAARVPDVAQRSLPRAKCGVTGSQVTRVRRGDRVLVTELSRPTATPPAANGEATSTPSLLVSSRRRLPTRSDLRVSSISVEAGGGIRPPASELLRRARISPQGPRSDRATDREKPPCFVQSAYYRYSSARRCSRPAAAKAVVPLQPRCHPGAASSSRARRRS